MNKLVTSIRDYFKSAYAEILKVSWPSRKDTLRLTTVVLIVSVIVAIILGSADVVYRFGLEKALDSNNPQKIQTNE